MITLEACKVIEENKVVVRVYAKGNVDRKDVYGWVGIKPAVADRLVAAVNAGKAVTVDGIKTDINGRTYVATTHYVMGRHMDRDLKALGF